MPELDGIETARRIRSITGDETGIIILTAYKWDDVVEKGTAAGVDSFVSKPLFAGNVLEEFRSAMLRKGISANSSKGKADLAGKRILIAEDVEVNAEIMQMVLRMRDIETDIAENGKLAVRAFENHEPGYYAAILMDIRMPEMDGLEATKLIRGMDRADAGEIPIIALTANAFDEDVQRSLQSGMNAHLSKPVQPDVLFETLESLIS
jgi:CheY-like chemotaxis protein